MQLKAVEHLEGGYRGSQTASLRLRVTTDCRRPCSQSVEGNEIFRTHGLDHVWYWLEPRFKYKLLTSVRLASRVRPGTDRRRAPVTSQSFHQTAPASQRASQYNQRVQLVQLQAAQRCALGTVRVLEDFPCQREVEFDSEKRRECTQILSRQNRHDSSRG